jgi:macrolide-specific efflux system membrane fusion protein
MTVQVSFVTAFAEDVLLVPLAAITQQGRADGDPGLYTARVLDAESQPQARTLRIGRQDAVAAEVLEGLAPGEAVIVREMDPALLED